MEHREEFEKQGYSFLPEFIDAETAKAFCKVVKEAEGWSDEQVPGAKSLRNHSALDGMLEQVLPNVEFASGKRLLPTYAYARVYKKGDVLKPHKDRPACEISVTLCLGSDGSDPWPIYMSDCEPDAIVWNKDQRGVYLKPGDACMYKGCEKTHWRDEFKGEWMAQVFLHYVDADGPYADWKYDKRTHLAHHAVSSGLPNYVIIEDAINPASAMKVVEQLEAQEGEQAGIGGVANTINTDVRDVKKIAMPLHRGIAAAMAGIGLNANQQNWRFDVTHANQCDFLRYHGDGGHYHAHVDTFMDRDQPCRKLSILCFLNDDFEGGRFFLQTGDKKDYPPQKAGTVLVFPSFMLHGVEPVTKGTRCSMITWLVGPWFK